jgi:adenine-specific DNA-methyltransferase
MSKTTEFKQLCIFLKDMFQLEDHDLDFGIYRIIRLKRQFIQNFIDGDGENSLQQFVTRALTEIQNAKNDTAYNWLAAFASRFGDMGRPLWQEVAKNPSDKGAIDNFKSLLANPILSDEQHNQAEGHLKTFTETRQISAEELETRVYNHLLNFFELYYQNGDFGYNTRAASAFRVPYEADYDGSDTLFHWKHKDSYYIKTGNGFHKVLFEIGSRWIEFRLSGSDDEAQTEERNNNKGSDTKHYRLIDIRKVEEFDRDGRARIVWQVRFALANASTPKVELFSKLWEIVFGDEKDLTPYLHKKPAKGEEPPGKPLFNDLADDYDKTDGGSVKGVGQLRIKFEKYTEKLAKRQEFRGLGKNENERQEQLSKDATVLTLWKLDRNLNKFFIGNDSDYFIHKNLQSFLTQEKARFIKQIIFSDIYALLNADEENTTTLIARAFNTVADTLIGFLSAIEDFQKGLFELKKKVVDTHYLISVGKIPVSFYGRIFACEAQIAEWREVFKVEFPEAAQLSEHPTLVVDTSLYHESDPTFQDDLLTLDEFGNLDQKIDGLLINSENWQALNLIQEKFREYIKCIYIDPPYNTGGDGFLYKDSFRHSSWASMIHDRLKLAYPLLSKNGVLFASIDDKERTQLENQLKQIFGTGNRVEELIWAQNTNKNKSPTYSTNHEYVEVFARNLERAKSDQAMFRETKPGYVEIMELVEQYNRSYPRISAIEKSIAKLFEQHRQEFREELEKQRIDFDKNLDPWKGLYNYKNAEYRDSQGKYISENEAKNSNARIWVWRESDSSMPQVKQDSQKPEFRDPNHPAFRFYKPRNPETDLESPHPKRGWAWPYKRMEGQASCFVGLEKDRRISWGKNKKKIPQVKRFLHEAETNVGKSVVLDYSDGEKDLTATTGKTRTFASPKPVSLIERFIQQTTTTGEWILDFFAGSGTTGHAAIRSNEDRRFLLVEMGKYFDSILKSRIKRIMYSTRWKNGSPVNQGLRGWMVEVQTFEQYEDILDNLIPIWDENDLPPRIPVRYLFHPEEKALTASLDLSRPFNQTLRVGKTREEKTIDLMETWCYLQGYWIKSRRVYREFDRSYLVVETTHATLIVFRDINDAEDDTDNLNAILSKYVDENGLSLIQRMEVNHEADLRRLKVDTILISTVDFMRGAQWS